MATTGTPAAARRSTQPTYTPPPPPMAKPSSPWIPFSITFLLIAGVAGGLFYFIDMKFTESKNEAQAAQASLLKTNNFVMTMDARLKKIEDNIAQSDEQANAEGSTLTGKLMNLETRIASAEKNIGWNSSRVNKQVTDIESLQNSVTQVESSVSSQNNKINELAQKLSTVASTSTAIETINQKVESNTQAIETIDAHRTRLSSAIQNTQADVARLIRLYEKDNPNVKRVH